MRNMRNTLLASATVLLGACAPAIHHTPANTIDYAATVLVVQNDNPNIVQVHLIRSGQRVRLGSVTPMSEATFHVPDSFLVGAPDIILTARPVGSTHGYVSPPMQVFPGAQMELLLRDQLRLSNALVYAAR